MSKFKNKILPHTLELGEVDNAGWVYECEIFDSNGESVAFQTITQEQLKKYWKPIKED
jgi:hypothetical protein